MATLADIILILSVLGLIVGLIKPKLSLFHFITNGKYSRGTIAKKFGIGIAAGLALLFIVSLSTPSTPAKKDTAKTSASATTSQQATVDTSTPAYKLAAYDVSAPTPAIVNNYQKALDTLKPLCTVKDENKLASLVYGTWKDLEDNGIKDETNLTVANHIIASIPASTAPVDCQGIMAAYLVQREGN